MNESDESKKKKNNVHCGCTQAETIFDCQQEWGRTKRSCSPNCHRQNYLGKLIRWTNSALNELFTTWIPTKSFASTARIQILAFSKHYWPCYLMPNFFKNENMWNCQTIYATSWTMIGPSFLIWSILLLNYWLDQLFGTLSMDLAKNADARSVTSSNLLDQLRQLTTKFNAPSSYYLCRASGPITKSHQCHPYSMFTLADFDCRRNPASQMFTNIAVNIFKYGD